MGIGDFYFLWAQAEREREADYRQGWNYAGAAEILKLSPNQPAPHTAMASVWMKNKQYEKAVVEYGKAVKLEPNNPYNHLDLGNALILVGKTAEARKEWQAAVRLDVTGGQAQADATHQLDIHKMPAASFLE